MRWHHLTSGGSHTIRLRLLPVFWVPKYHLLILSLGKEWERDQRSSLVSTTILALHHHTMLVPHYSLRMLFLRKAPFCGHFLRTFLYVHSVLSLDLSTHLSAHYLIIGRWLGVHLFSYLVRMFVDTQCREWISTPRNDRRDMALASL